MDYAKVFEAVVSDPRYLASLDWGEAREGHPEGTVRAHIAEIGANLEAIRPRLSDDEYWKLKILVHTHDSFKGAAKPGVAITHRRSHASLARGFLAEHCDDADLLAMLQFHDEPFAIYKKLSLRGKRDDARMDALLASVRDWSLFLAFCIIDGCTAGKSREPLRWFFQQVAGRVESRFTAADIIE